jgi:hypothetical protein
MDEPRTSEMDLGGSEIGQVYVRQVGGGERQNEKTLFPLLPFSLPLLSPLLSRLMFLQPTT